METYKIIYRHDGRNAAQYIRAKSEDEAMIREFDNGIFPRIVVITDDLDEANGYYIGIDGLPLEEPENAIATTYRTTNKNNGNACVLLAIFLDDMFDNGTKSHESLHIARCILDGIVDELNDSTEEVWCYLAGWVTRCIDDFIKDKEYESKKLEI